MPVDFRKGATGLMALVRDGGANPFNGALYVFRSKRADRIKAVWFDGTGVCLFAKTLEDAQFDNLQTLSRFQDCRLPLN